jgi:hypothetical protein
MGSGRVFVIDDDRDPCDLRWSWLPMKGYGVTRA